MCQKKTMGMCEVGGACIGYGRVHHGLKPGIIIVPRSAKGTKKCTFYPKTSFYGKINHLMPDLNIIPQLFCWVNFFVRPTWNFSIFSRGGHCPVGGNRGGHCQALWVHLIWKCLNHPSSNPFCAILWSFGPILMKNESLVPPGPLTLRIQVSPWVFLEVI